MPTESTAAQEAIEVSVVVPTCGRPDLLDRNLDALARQDLAPSRYEIIVVDDAASHLTLHLVAGWRGPTAARGLRLSYLANHGVHGPAAARNLGWRAATAPIIAFTDDDTIPARDWLRNGLAAFADDTDALCGRVEMPLPQVPTDYQRDASHLTRAEFVTANCFCRKSVLEALQGFDERFRFAWREDSDLHFRLLKMRANIVRCPQALVVHPVRPAPWGVSVLQLRKISADALLYKKHPELYRQRIRRVPRWDYYAIVALLLLAALSFAARAAVAGWMALGLWAIFTIAFCLKRLNGTAKSASHIADMVFTSALIPPLAVFWRIVGAVRFRVRFV